MLQIESEKREVIGLEVGMASAPPLTQEMHLFKKTGGIFLLVW